MKPVAQLLLLLSACAALADIGVRQGGTYIGPARDIDMLSDAGLYVYRDAGVSIARLACVSASATETGCVTPGTQNWAGNKSLSGNLTVKADAGVAGNMLISGTATVSNGAAVTGNATVTGYVQNVGVASGSLPTCNSTTKGALHFDTTDTRHVLCDGAQWAWPSRVLSVNVTQVGNGADTTEDDLMTYTLPAGLLSANGMGIRLTAWGTLTTGTGNVQTVRCKFGGTTFANFSTSGIPSYASWRIQGEVIRTASATQVGFGWGTFNDGLFVPVAANELWTSGAFPTSDTTNPIIIKCTGQRATTASANSIVQYGMIIEAL